MQISGLWLNSQEIRTLQTTQHFYNHAKKTPQGTISQQIRLKHHPVPGRNGLLKNCKGVMGMLFQGKERWYWTKLTVPKPLYDLHSLRMWPAHQIPQEHYHLTSPITDWLSSCNLSIQCLLGTFLYIQFIRAIGSCVMPNRSTNHIWLSVHHSI